MKLSDAQRGVLQRLADGTQPDTSEQITVDALVRRDLVTFVRSRGQYKITRAGRKVLKEEAAA